MYGEMNIEIQNNRLLLRLRGQNSLLYHFHYGQFNTKEEATGKPDFRINFFTNSKGEIDRFNVQLFGDTAEFVKKH